MAIPVWQDILERKQEIVTRQWVQENAPEYILRNLERGANEPWLVGADGLFYHDTRAPILSTVDGTATILTTAVPIHSAQYTNLPANYYTVGKKLRLVIWGAWTTVLTPGNWTTQIRSSNAAAGGVLMATSATVAANASKTSIMTKIEAYITCRTIGTAGTVMAVGSVMPDQAGLVLPAANTPQLIPASAPAVSPTFDMTAASAVSIQMLRSGSTAETFIAHDLTFEALN